VIANVQPTNQDVSRTCHEAVHTTVGRSKKLARDVSKRLIPRSGVPSGSMITGKDNRRERLMPRIPLQYRMYKIRRHQSSECWQFTFTYFGAPGHMQELVTPIGREHRGWCRSSSSAAFLCGHLSGRAQCTLWCAVSARLPGPRSRPHPSH